MCNPRRIRVQATRHLSETWEQEVSRQVQRHGTAVGRASVREPLGRSVGAPTLAALAAALHRSPQWEERDGAFVHPLTGGELLYHVGEQELEIVAFATEEVQATGSAATVVHGEVDEHLTVEGTGVYYTDGYRHTSAATARAAAEVAAQSALTAAAQQSIARARAAADQAQGAEMQRRADEQAQQELDRLTAERGEQLGGAAEARLTAVGVQGRNIFHQILAEAYRDAVLAYARSRHAQGLTVTESGGVLDIEFEIEV